MYLGIPLFWRGEGCKPSPGKVEHLHKKAASGEKVLHGARFTEQKQIDGPPCINGLSIINWLLKIIQSSSQSVLNFLAFLDKALFKKKEHKTGAQSYLECSVAYTSTFSYLHIYSTTGKI